MRFYRKFSFLFTLFMFMFVSLVFIISLGYDETTRLVPLIVLTPALAMALFLLIGEFFPRLLRGTTVKLISIGMESTEAEPSVNGAYRLVGRKGLLISTGWLVGFTIVVLLVGFLIAIPVALFVFLKVLGGQNWFRSLAITIISSAFIYVVFNVLLKLDLFRGILFGEIVTI